jgi:hypothetical protein
VSDALSLPAVKNVLLADGHVHFHRCFTWPAFLEAATVNLARARARLGLAADVPACLMLTESAGVSAYRVLSREPSALRSSGWHVGSTDEACSLVVSRRRALPHGHLCLESSRREAIIVVAGRQIVTAERLEVLALALGDEVPDGRPCREVLREVTDRGALAVIPWGVGKWLGRRGRLVRDLIAGGCEVPFCLGDNGGRAGAMGRPSLFDVAERSGVPVLAGSDPLPMPEQVCRVGSYGFVLGDWQATSRPAAKVTAKLRELRGSPPAFGELASIPTMVRAQLALRWQRAVRSEVEPVTSCKPPAVS